MLSSLGHSGLIVLASLALVSGLSMLIVLAFLSSVIQGRRVHVANQALILSFCLTLANLVQSIGLVLSFHWVLQDGILHDNPLCYAQGGLLTFGSVSTCLFVLAIAIHALYVHAKALKVDTKIFFAGIAFLWILAAFLASIGPMKYGNRFYGEASTLCWIHQKYFIERLLLHDVWLFLAEFGTILIYLALAVVLIVRYHKDADDNQGIPLTHQNLKTITGTMMLFAMAHIVCDLLLVTARLMDVAGNHAPSKLLAIAACFVASSGWLTAVLFAATYDILTRPSIITIPPPPTPPPSNVPHLAKTPRRATPSGPYGNRVSAEATLLGTDPARTSRRISLTPDGKRLSKRLSGPKEGVKSDVNIKQDVSVEQEENLPAEDLPANRITPAPVIPEDERSRLSKYGDDSKSYHNWD